ncbi:MAG: DUF4124 domain-containing protein [Casimicrobiaceae bacterium]
MRLEFELMRTPIRRSGAWLAVVAGVFALPLAHADIYTWVDAAGSINVGNIAPPKDGRVVKVTHANAPETAARIDAAREAARRAETQALEERVRQLEREVASAKRQAPPPVAYRDVTASPPPRYRAPPPVQYAVVATPPAYGGCDPGWMGCGSWWSPAIYPASVIVLRTPGFRRFPAVRAGRHMTVGHPGRPIHGSRRG